MEKRNAEMLTHVHTDPEILRRFEEGLEARSQNSVWRGKNANVLADARARRTEAALLKDASCSPEEAARRVKARERNRRYYAKRRLAVS